MMSLKQDNRRPVECNCDQANLHLHVEIENLKQRLLEKERHIIKMETNFLKESERFPNGEFAAAMEELLTWQEKYSRLYEAHKRVQKVNQGLEDKLLKMVDKCETDKTLLNGEIVSLTRRYVERQSIAAKLQDENERYRNDLNIAISLLQCKPSNFVPQKFDLLPSELQTKVRTYVTNKQRKQSDGGNNGNNGSTQKSDMKTIRVPIPTFPPTAMVFSLGSDKDQNDIDSVNSKQQQPVDIVSAAIMAKVLEEREKERINAKHCQTCSCNQHSQLFTKSTQTGDNILDGGTALVLATNNSGNVSNDADTINNVINSANINYQNNNNGDRCPNIKESNQCNIVPWSPASSDKSSHKDSSELQNDYSSDESYTSFRSSRQPKSVSINFKDDSNRDLISFDSSPCNEIYKGPRPCSVRLQIGSNNILLDNTSQCSSPVLYRRRDSNNETPEPLVHSTRNQCAAVSSNNNANNLCQYFSTETEI